MADSTEPSEDIQVKVADNGKGNLFTNFLNGVLIYVAAENFVSSYYPSLNTPQGQKRLTEFYIKPTTAAPAQADIVLNGNTVSSPEELQAMFENQVERCLYEAQSVDCQVLNANYNVGLDDRDLGQDKKGDKVSFMVMVCGSVKYLKEGTDGDVRGFTETFVMVPNMAAHGPKAPRGLRKWLIQSQVFRLVV